MLKGKKASLPVDGGNFPLIPGYFLPWVRVTRAPFPVCSRGFFASLLLLPSNRETTFRQEAYWGKVRFESHRVHTLLRSSNSMTFHDFFLDFFHDLFQFSMTLRLSVIFENFQNLTAVLVLAHIFFLPSTVQQKQTLVSTKMHAVRAVY